MLRRNQQEMCPTTWTLYSLTESVVVVPEPKGESRRQTDASHPSVRKQRCTVCIENVSHFPNGDNFFKNNDCAGMLFESVQHFIQVRYFLVQKLAFFSPSNN